MNEERIPYIYLDTNALLDIIRPRRKGHESSLSLVDKIKFGKIRACTSALSLLQLVDKEQEHILVWRRIKEGCSFDEILRERAERALKPYELEESVAAVDSDFTTKYKKYIVFYKLLNEGWDRAMELMQSINLTSEDAIHLASALEAKCNLLVTRDSHLLAGINASNLIAACIPEEVEQKLKELGSQ